MVSFSTPIFFNSIQSQHAHAPSNPCRATARHLTMLQFTLTLCSVSDSPTHFGITILLLTYLSTYLHKSILVHICIFLSFHFSATCGPRCPVHSRWVHAHINIRVHIYTYVYIIVVSARAGIHLKIVRKQNPYAYI